MTTATQARPQTRPLTRTVIATADRVDSGMPATFFAAVTFYREQFWKRLDRPAAVAYRECDDMTGVRWWKALPGAKAATLRILREAYPGIDPGPDGKRLFVRAVREAALGCIR